MRDGACKAHSVEEEETPMPRVVLSQNCVDAVVDWAFRWLPAMDPDDLAAFIQGILRILDAELGEAVRKERDVLAIRARERSRN
jgi:hypothetical protein